MRNDQHTGVLPESVSAADLHRRVLPCSPDHRVEGAPEKPLLDGHLRFFRIGADVSVHCVDATELADSRSSGECPAGLSVNILLAGQVGFALGAEHYRCSAEAGPAGIALALRKAEPFTRFLSAGSRVRKVNVSVSRQWLSERLGDVEAGRVLQRSVRLWEADAGQVRLARRLLALSRAPACSVLAIEALAVELIGRILDASEAGQPVSPDLPAHSGAELRQLLAPYLEGECDLAGLAHKLGMSVSTLQRRFKRLCGVTVMEYVRSQRLERARRAMLLHGMSVQEAAYLAGYDHPSNFVSAFKRAYGTTPAALIRTHRQELSA
ncbi:helix-turn-helix transcriptional regulator [Gilvimarinus algae]|uniref:Helix-turn-helix transcriptional regulator n=1 Tax=Gilvimarinus algae TaxID=3058037 RepID=A0ABT8TE40_9GAMM|nr:helix-turn-helix transcriptional regulator [Gilvimarinus sp. SDUM040014]MDO3381819.1 helix-turn-helix transcriptional regulator [Gilvimarinus sp. SDUM040014]